MVRGVSNIRAGLAVTFMRLLVVGIYIAALSAFAMNASLAGDIFPGTTISGSGSIGGNNTGANVEAGEPTAGGNVNFNPVNSLWYSWTAPATGVLVVQTCGVAVTNFDTVLGIYTGTAVGALTSLAFNDDATNCAISGNNNYGSSISLDVTAGTVYRIQVDGYAAAVGTFLLQYNFTPQSPIIVLVSDGTATEGGDAGTFQVRLGSAPTANVTVNIAADPAGQCTFSAASLTFTTANWNTLQSVTVTPVNDLAVEGTHTCSTGAITATGGGFTGQTGTPPVITITDNDTPSLIVLTTDSIATEGGDTAAFTVRLGAPPSANVSVTIGTSSQCSFAPSPLTFTTANWNTNQTVTVTATNDTLVEGVHSCVTGAIAASGGGYTGITGAAQTFTVNDNDIAGITITTTTASATEGGANGAFTVVLTGQPSANVTVAIGADGTGQCSFAPSTLTFTNANWNTPQTVTTTAVNDTLVEGAYSCATGAITASGPAYTGVTGTAPTFTITDNDTGAIAVTTTTSTATEGGANGAFTVVLTAQPAGNVTVTIGADGTGQCTFAPSPLTFTSANWNTAQTVITTAVNDLLVEGAHNCTTGAIAASGSGYTSVTGTAPTFTITDNDTGAITVTTTTPNATEGGANGAFTVVLTAQPAGNVTVVIGADGTGQCTFAPSPLTFTSANWNTAQTVITTAVNDLLVEGAHNCTTGAIAASGSGYTGVTGTAPTFTITDNDIGSIALVKTASVTSVAAVGVTITYTIRVTNTGNVNATGLTLTDTLGPIVCPTSGGNTIATLLPSGFESCTATYVANQTDFDTNGGGDGDIDNSASVSGTAGGISVNATDTAAVLCTPVSGLTVIKSANRAGPLTVGEIITYEFRAFNNGNVTLNNVTINETAFNGASPPLGIPAQEVLVDNAPLNTPLQQSTDLTPNNGTWSTLKPNDVAVFKLDYTVTQADIDLLQ